MRGHFEQCTSTSCCNCALLVQRQFSNSLRYVNSVSLLRFILTCIHILFHINTFFPRPVCSYTCLVSLTYNGRSFFLLYRYRFGILVVIRFWSTALVRRSCVVYSPSARNRFPRGRKVRGLPRTKVCRGWRDVSGQRQVQSCMCNIYILLSSGSLGYLAAIIKFSHNPNHLLKDVMSVPQRWRRRAPIIRHLLPSA